MENTFAFRALARLNDLTSAVTADGPRGPDADVRPGTAGAGGAGSELAGTPPTALPARRVRRPTGAMTAQAIV
jgi:hypothetical protein